MMSMKLAILSAKKKIESVEVPELGITVNLKRMSGTEREVFQTAQLKAQEQEKVTGSAVCLLPLQPLLLSLTLCDPIGNRIFDNPDEVKEIDGIVIDRLATRALEINGLTQESRLAIEKKALESIGSCSTSPTN